MYIDVHCHLTDDYSAVGGVDEVIARANAAGVKRIICSGYDLLSSQTAARLAEKHESVYFSAGFHPSEWSKYKDGDFERLKELCKHEKCVAVGEIGLDYHFDDNPSAETQRKGFIEQLHIARELKKPVVLHSRDAAQETLEILQANKDCLQSGALMHCYSYSAEMSERFAALDVYFSFGGPCTFKNAKKVFESVERIPASRILSETDCPYLTPVPHRGEFPNQPVYVQHVVSRLAQLRGVTEEEMKKQIWQNAETLFFNKG